MVGKNNLAASTLKLFHDDILISELSRESIGRKNDDRFDPALRNRITQAIQRRAVKRRPAVAVILINLLRADLIIMTLRIIFQCGDLRSDVFIELLFSSGDTCIQSGDFHEFPPVRGVAVKARVVSVAEGF